LTRHNYYLILFYSLYTTVFTFSKAIESDPIALALFFALLSPADPATAVLGNFINAGVGVNSTYIKYKEVGGSSKDKWTDMTYHFKAGIQFPILDIFWLNVDAYYFVDELKDIEDFNKDYISFGARLHYLF